jgi:hypothetical protein
MNRGTKCQDVLSLLASVRPALPITGNWLDFFDEFVEHREFDLALHSICDYLLEAESPATDLAVIESLAALHESMQIEDDCIKRLLGKN